MTTIVCLGDSITEGEGDALHIGWVGRLNMFLQEKMPQTYVVYNLGISGDTLAGAYGRYHSEVLLRRPDLVILAIGTNNCQRSGVSEPSELHSGLLRLMTQWEEWTKYLKAGVHQTVVLGVLPTDEGCMPYVYEGYPNTWVLNTDLESYNNHLAAFCQKHDLPFINFWEKWTPEMCKSHMADGLHPNALGYEFMVGVIKEFLEENKIV